MHSDRLRTLCNGLSALTFRFLSMISHCQATVAVLLCTVRSTSFFVMRALNEPPRDRKKEKHHKHYGNIILEQVSDIARTIRSRSIRRTITSSFGTAFSIGCKVIHVNSKLSMTTRLRSNRLGVRLLFRTCRDWSGGRSLILRGNDTFTLRHGCAFKGKANCLL